MELDLIKSDRNIRIITIMSQFIHSDPSKRHSVGEHALVGAESGDKGPTSDTSKLALSKIAGLKKAKSPTLHKQAVFDTSLEEGEEPGKAPLAGGATPLAGPTDDPAITLTSYAPLNSNNNNNNNKKRKGTQRLGFSQQHQQQNGGVSRGRVQRPGLSRQHREEETARRSGSTTVMMGQKTTSGSDLLRPPTSDLSQRNSKSASEIFVTWHQSSSSDSSERGAVFSSRRHPSAGGGASARPHLSRSGRTERGGRADGDSGKGISIVSFDEDEHSESTI